MTPPADEAAPARHPLLPATRWLLPAAVVLGAAGLALARGPTRVVYVALLGVIALLWALSMLRRPVLVVDARGYRVEVRRRVVVQVGFDEVKRVRAVPAEHAMYVDCGDPARNLLLPPRGYGFRFARQAALYQALAARLRDVEVVERLVPEPPLKNGHNRPRPGDGA